ncbi:hypothetical protein CL615_03945 [archaeon]|nr:hypothetical protein [archaeon]MDP6547967.1 hypothetical protein [Candidatus Woesearchaeota archaeon]|tara:strand:- start:74450 stop:75358 length:909 start_codon:yes stop_codon:yes gene_type:complete
MDIIDDIKANKKEIINCINKRGFVREHNFWFYCNQQNNYSKIFFLKFDNNCGIFAIRYESGTWELIGEVIAPEKKRLELFNNFLNYTLNKKKDKKAFVFVPEKFHNNVSSMLKNSDKYRITGKPTVYYTPIFSMKKWDESLKGKEGKKLRYIKNKFLKSHNVEIIPSKEIDEKKLRDIVNKWRKLRPKAERTYYTDFYLNFIKNGFEGTDIARTVIIDNEPCTITAGWKIPNTKNYYSAIGLYNYKYDGLGEIANIDDLNEIKNKKYKYADFGDSSESLLQFKKKFNPDYIYKTYWFHIVKK